MNDPTDFMQRAAQNPDAGASPPPIPTDRPTPARVYDYCLGGKDNFAVDREWVHQLAPVWVEGVDMARHNRMFLYRAVRYLAREVGLTQFLDLGSGLPTQDNVHEVAQRFQPEARVVYVDNDPIVLAHGRALLSKDEDSTVVLTADLTEPEAILDHAEIRRVIDFSRPVGVLMFSIPHCIPDDDAARAAIRGPVESVVPGSYLALSHVVSDTHQDAEDSTRQFTELGMPWRTRLPADVDRWLADLQAVEPGLCDINDWRPDPEQPALPEVAPEIRRYLGASQGRRRIYEYGGVLRKP